ncbi:amidohydrolase family protein [Kordiimonas laminariae]|uniref:amidohydrolase family protein n=1 Tax=Kordiimonas laminariae TaxID=2917717 RepID=UPI001FF4AA05|nr:amidohydrolase [Kordiimonas laminariae]MCK0068931.1 amidohydrolase [Kordiimonas laminariae]
MKMFKYVACAVFSLFALSAAEAGEKKKMDKLSADMIVAGSYVVTMDEKQPLIENGAVAVKNGEIIYVGSKDDVFAKYTAAEMIDGEGKALMPGFVNGHTHSSMVLFRGMADDLELMTWLQKYIFPMEGRYVDPELIEAGTSLACYEMIQSGTTSFVDMYFYPDVIADVVDRCGMRAIISAPMIDFPSPGFKGWDDSYAAGVEYVKRWKEKAHPRIKPALAPHAPYTVSKEHLEVAFKTAQELDVPVSIHVAEDQAETKTIGDKYGKSSIQLLSEIGMLDQHTIAAHVVWPTEEDIKTVAGKSFGAIHNPTSNMKTGAGVAPVPALLEAGVHVGLGTDGAASNNDLDMWEEMRLAALIHKGVATNPTVVPAYEALKMATRGGAIAAGMEETGALIPGLKADMIQISLDSPRLTPLYDIMSQLVYAANSSDVVTSIVEGKVLMKDRTILTLDETKIKADVEKIASKIRADLKAQK